MKTPKRSTQPRKPAKQAADNADATPADNADAPTDTPADASADVNADTEHVETAEEAEARIDQIKEWKSGMPFESDTASIVSVLREIASLFGLGVSQHIHTVQNMPELVNRFRWLTRQAGAPLSASAAAAANAAFRDMCEQMAEYIKSYLTDLFSELYEDDSYNCFDRVSDVLLKNEAQFAAVENGNYFVSQTIVDLWRLLRIEASRNIDDYSWEEYANGLYLGGYEQTDGAHDYWKDRLFEKGLAAYEQFFSAFEAQRRVIAEELAQLRRIADGPQEPVAATQVESASTEPTSNGKSRRQWRRFDKVVIPILIEELGYESEGEGENVRPIFTDHGRQNYDSITTAIQLAHNEANLNPGKNSPVHNRLIHEAYREIVAAEKTREYIESLRLHCRRQRLRGR